MFGEGKEESPKNLPFQAAQSSEYSNYTSNSCERQTGTGKGKPIPLRKKNYAGTLILLNTRFAEMMCRESPISLASNPIASPNSCGR